MGWDIVEITAQITVESRYMEAIDLLATEIQAIIFLTLWECIQNLCLSDLTFF